MVKIALLDGPLHSDYELPNYVATPAEIHALAVAAAIRSVCSKVQVLSYPIFEEKLRTNRMTVVRKLEQAMESDSDILHCSFGFPNSDTTTAVAFKKAVDHFACVVASSPSRGPAVFPASYPGILKASGDARVTGDKYSWLNTAKVDFAADSSAPAGFSIAGASIGAARISGIIANLLFGNHPVDDLQGWLRRNATHTGPELRLI